MPSIVVYKSDRRLVMGNDCFRAGLGRSPIGHKGCEGDGKTPEGEYNVCTRNENSKYHLALGLSYPNIDDASRALADGAIDEAQYEGIRAALSQGKRPPWDTPLGGFIMIHGGGATDWTAGCIALDNADMDAVFARCPIGTRVRIVP